MIIIIHLTIVKTLMEMKLIIKIKLIMVWEMI
jgi:hypothetical protein